MRYYRHRGGGVYATLHDAQMEATGERAVVYQGAALSGAALTPSGTVWIRPHAEFHDGRFTLISPHDARRLLRDPDAPIQPGLYESAARRDRCPDCWRSDSAAPLGAPFLGQTRVSCRRCNIIFFWGNA